MSPTQRSRSGASQGVKTSLQASFSSPSLIEGGGDTVQRHQVEIGARAGLTALLSGFDA